MLKYIVLLLVLCGLEAFASPSATYGRDVAGGCGGPAECARVATSTSVTSELSRAIELAVKAAIALTDKDVPTTNPAPTLMGSTEEVASVVSAAVRQVIKEFTPQSCTNEEIAAIVEPWKVTIQNLTRVVEQLTAPTSPAPPTPAPHCNDERVALYQLSLQDLTQSVAELTQRMTQLSTPSTTPTPLLCVIGYELSPVTNRYYKLYNELVRWPVAEQRCRGDGAHLAIINSREETVVLSAIRRQSVNNIGCFIGVYKNSDGRWITTTGEDVVAAAGYDVWRTGEDWSNSKWRYGEMWEDNMIGGRDQDTRYFICERAP